MPKLKLNHCRLTLVVHYKEWRKPTNSGRIAVRALQPARALLRGDPSGDRLLITGETKDDSIPVVLFPDPDAEVLSKDWLRNHPGKIHLIVPDGNWRQASKMPKREPIMANAFRLKLPILAATQYKLRREHRQVDGLATLEAIARAMGIIESPFIEQQLLKVFDIMVQRTLLSKGIISQVPNRDYEPEASI